MYINVLYGTRIMRNTDKLNIFHAVSFIYISKRGYLVKSCNLYFHHKIV